MSATASSTDVSFTGLLWIDRFLQLFTRPVYRGEGISAFLLAANVFLLLTTYYLLKTVRESLILSSGGAEVKSYASAGQALLLLGVVPLYGWLVARVNRVTLIASVTLFFAANLGLFLLLEKAGFAIEVPFFLWLGIFNVMVVAQFWAFASDVYDEEQGKRLFPFVGVGSSVGALTGSRISGPLVERMGPESILVIAMVLLVICAGAPVWINRYRCAVCTYQSSIGEKQIGGRGALSLVLNDRFLLLIAILVMLLNIVNTAGEFLLGRMVVEEAARITTDEASRRAFIGSFYGNYFTFVSLLGLVLQLFFVSPLFRLIGVRGALFVLPCLALGGYALLAATPVLGVARITKVLENSCDYSIQNTARHALFLNSSRDAKYKAKQVIDTFFWRAGDLLQAGIVFAGSSLHFSTRDYAVVNLALVAAWLCVVMLLYWFPKPAEQPA